MRIVMQHEGNASTVFTAAAVSQLPVRDRVGFDVHARNAVDALARVGEAERAGVRQVWRMTGYAGQADTLTFYAAAGVQTTQIRLGTAIGPIYPRHPLVMAQQALAIHDLAPGRLRLGVGPSHRHTIEQVDGRSMKSPLAYLRAHIERLRSLPYATMHFYAHMFAEAGVPVAPDGSGIDVLVDALVVAGNEAAVQQRIRALLASGLDELLITPIPVADEERERQQLLHLIGSL